MRTPDEIATYLQEGKIAFIAQNLSTVVLGYPDMILSLYKALSGGQAKSLPVHIKRRDGSLYGIQDGETILRAARELPGFGVGADYLRMVPRAVIERLGDDLIQSGLMKTDVPLLQFVRHARNGSSHGNRWHFHQGRVPHPATLRTITLDPSYQGGEVFWETIGQGDWLDLVDDVVGYLRALP